MKNCDKYAEMMSLAIDNQLSGKRLDEFNRHLDQCETCKAEFHDLKSLVSELEQLPELDLPEGFHERAMRKIHLDAVNSKEEKRGVLDILGFVPDNFLPVAASVAACFILLSGAVSAINMGLPGGGSADNMAKHDTQIVQYNAPASIPEAETEEIEISGETGAAYFSGPVMEMKADEGPAYDMAARSASEAADQKEMGKMSEDMVLDAVPQLAQGGLEASMSPDSAFGAEPFAASMADVSGGIYGDHIGVLNKNGYVRLETADVASAVSQIRGAGWDIEASAVSAERGSFTLKVPSWEYESALSYMNSLGRTISQTEHAADLTYETNELAVSYLSKAEEADRIYALINQAETVDDMLLLQDRLKEIVYDQEMYKSQYKANLDLSDNYTIDVNIVAEAVYETERVKAFPERIALAFTGSVNMTTGFFEGAMVLLSRLILPAALIGALAAVARFFWKWFSERRRR